MRFRLGLRAGPQFVTPRGGTVILTTVRNELAIVLAADTSGRLRRHAWLTRGRSGRDQSILATLW